MKRYMGYFVAIAIFAIAPAVFAASWDLSGISTNVGKGAFISGFDIGVKFADTTSSGSGAGLNVTGNHQRVYAILGQKLLSKLFYVAVSGGAFQNMPWLGPYIEFYPTSWLKFQHWSGFGAGRPNEPRWERPDDFFVSNSAFLRVNKYVSLSFVTMTFLGEWTMLPGVRFSVPINSKYAVSFGIEYKTQVQKEEALFSIGVAYAKK